MTEHFEVAKWGRQVPLADGTCHCGQPIKYNLMERVVGHTDPDANADCSEPWPDVPASGEYELSRRTSGILQQGAQLLDRAYLAAEAEPNPVNAARWTLDEEPQHAAARQRTDEERAALAPPVRVGRWVVGKGWVPVDGLGPYEGAVR